MTDARNVEGRISDWLEAEEAGTRYPDRLLIAAFEETRGSRQARSFHWAFPALRMPRSLAVTGAAAVLLVLAASGVYLGSQPSITGLESPTPDASPTVMPSPSQTSFSPPGYMWPQSTLAEARAAQELADAGDPDYAWQIDRDLGTAGALGQNHPGEGGDDAAIFGRFLEEELGWEKFLWTEAFAHPPGSDDGEITYIRCAAGRTNDLYPADPTARACAPTIDELTYETVRIRVGQPVRQGGTGIWVVTGWELGEPATQADPRVDKAGASALVEAFLQARIDGGGAEELAYLLDDTMIDALADTEIPLLYATSSGGAYERSEFELLEDPAWPHGGMWLNVRLFAGNDETVVEQHFFADRDDTGRVRLGYDLDAGTTENGEVVPAEYTFLDGEVTFGTAVPLAPMSAGDRGGEWLAIDGDLPGDEFPRRVLVMLADPHPIGPGCVEGTAPTDAEELAQSIQADSDFEATDPVAVTIGGQPALRMEVVLAPESESCTWLEGEDVSPLLMKNAPFGIYDRARLYLVDLPAGSKAKVLVLVTISDEDSLGTVVAAAAPIIYSIEFHAP